LGLYGDRKGKATPSKEEGEFMTEYKLRLKVIELETENFVFNTGPPRWGCLPLISQKIYIEQQ